MNDFKEWKNKVSFRFTFNWAIVRPFALIRVLVYTYRIQSSMFIMPKSSQLYAITFNFISVLKYLISCYTKNHDFYVVWFFLQFNSKTSNQDQDHNFINCDTCTPYNSIVHIFKSNTFCSITFSFAATYNDNNFCL